MSRFSPRNIMIHMIRLYQKYISPMKRTKCPYIPTCSQYGLEARSEEHTSELQSQR